MSGSEGPVSGRAPWTAAEAGRRIAVPRAGDDKYSRGVLGVVTGSDDYPGAAVLGVDAALHTGLGMVRYLGPRRAADLVLERCPEAVILPGRVQAWLLGSGIDADHRDGGRTAQLGEALGQGLPTVLDSGALDLVSAAARPELVVMTPHHRELGRVLGVDGAVVAGDPGGWAIRAARGLGVCVLLKGGTTHIAAPDGTALRVEGATAWLATAGTGDALGGILGALLATRSADLGRDPALLPELAATAALLHAEAAAEAGRGGPFTVRGLCAALPPVIARLLSGYAERR